MPSATLLHVIGPAALEVYIDTLPARLTRLTRLVCRANETTTIQMKSFVSTTTDAMTDVHRIRNVRQLCERCGTGHNKEQTCPAMGECYKCGRKNHFTKMCYTKPRPLYGIQTDEDDQVSTDMFIGAIQRARILPLNNQRMKFKIDTGAQCNMIPKQNYSKYPKHPYKSPLLTSWHLVVTD